MILLHYIISDITRNVKLCSFFYLLMRDQRWVWIGIGSTIVIFMDQGNYFNSIFKTKLCYTLKYNFSAYRQYDDRLHYLKYITGNNLQKLYSLRFTKHCFFLLFLLWCTFASLLKNREMNAEETFFSSFL